MKDVLDGVRTLFSDNSGSGEDLEGVKTFKRGVLPPHNVYPMVTVLPIGEEYIEYRSSRRTLTARTVEVHCLAKDLRGYPVYDTVEDLADKAYDLLKANHTLPDSESTERTIDIDLGSIDIQELESAEGGLADAFFDVDFISYEYLPAPTRVLAQIDNPATQTIGDLIYARLKDLGSTTLSDFREFAQGNMNRRALYPALIVATDAERQGDMWAGISDITGDYSIVLLSPVRGAADQDLIYHLDLVEPVKAGLLGEPNWGGNCLDTEITRISYSTYLRDSEKLYRTDIDLETLSKDER